MTTCPICQASMNHVFSATVLRKHEVAYRQCTGCGLMQTEEPYWLDEAYGDAIVLADTGLVARNLSLASKTAVLLDARFDPRAAYLDIAGGYGMLTRLMRDFGFDYYWQDKHCANLHARGFEAEAAARPFAAMTAFEVFEHLPDPLAFVRETMDRYGCRTLIFSTLLYEGAPPPRDWWYYAFNGGQHIAFYRRDTLETLASRLGLRFHTANGIHILTDRNLDVSPLLRLKLGAVAPAFALLVRRKLGSLTVADHTRLMDLAGRS